MSAFESSDRRWLARADEHSLELARHELVINCDDRREPVIDELLYRGAAAIAAEAARSGRARGLSAEQILSAGEEAVATLAMRIRAPVSLPGVTPLARDLVAVAIAARTPEPRRPPRLVWRTPDLDQVGDNQPPTSSRRASTPSPASIAAQVRNAARRGEIRPNDPRAS
jgi:hypothetical protein